jgi:hypothetical protein
MLLLDVPMDLIEKILLIVHPTLFAPLKDLLNVRMVLVNNQMLNVTLVSNVLMDKRDVLMDLVQSPIAVPPSLVL